VATVTGDMDMSYGRYGLERDNDVSTLCFVELDIVVYGEVYCPGKIVAEGR
jgi:hypothetical protein